MTHLARMTDAELSAVYAAGGPDCEAAWQLFASRHGERRDPIVTWHAFPPIPMRGFDWGAHRDSDEGGEGRTGWGRTEALAIADLLEQEAWEDAYDYDDGMSEERSRHP